MTITSLQWGVKAENMGLDRNTADCHYFSELSEFAILGKPFIPEHVPAWSLSALMRELNKWTRRWRLEPPTGKLMPQYFINIDEYNGSLPFKGHLCFHEYTAVATFCEAIEYMLDKGIPQKGGES